MVSIRHNPFTANLFDTTNFYGFDIYFADVTNDHRITPKYIKFLNYLIGLLFICPTALAQKTEKPRQQKTNNE